MKKMYCIFNKDGDLVGITDRKDYKDNFTKFLIAFTGNEFKAVKTYMTYEQMIDYEHKTIYDNTINGFFVVPLPMTDMDLYYNHMQNTVTGCEESLFTLLDSLKYLNITQKEMEFILDCIPSKLKIKIINERYSLNFSDIDEFKVYKDFIYTYY